MANLNSFGDCEVKECRYRNGFCQDLTNGCCDYGHSVEEILCGDPDMDDVREDIKDGIISVMQCCEANLLACEEHNHGLKTKVNGLIQKNQRLCTTIKKLKADKIGLRKKIQNLQRKQEQLKVRIHQHDKKMKMEKDKYRQLNSELETERRKYSRNNLKKLDINTLYQLMDECMNNVNTIKDEKNDRNFCIICCSNVKDCLFLPCKHLAFCTKCSNKIHKCPLCKEKIMEKIKCSR